MTFIRMAIAAALSGAAMLALSTAARADPRLDEKVYDPYVRNHVLGVETRAGRENGGPLNGAAAYIGELEYGVSDNLSLSLVGKIAGGAAEPTRLRGAGVEAVYYVGQVPGVGVDVGVYGEFMAGLNGEPNVLEGKLLLAKQIGRLQLLANLIAERPIRAPGESFGAYGYAASATWRVDGPFSVGVQAFGDLGDDHGFLKGRQGAYIGPAVHWQARLPHTPGELEVGLGWLKSVSESRHEADSQVRLTIEFERRF